MSTAVGLRPPLATGSFLTNLRASRVVCNRRAVTVRVNACLSGSKRATDSVSVDVHVLIADAMPTLESHHVNVRNSRYQSGAFRG